MVVVPLSKPMNETSEAPLQQSSDNTRWIRYAAAGTLAASGALLITGRRRAALVAAVSGTALAMLDQQDAIREWWGQLPVFLEELNGLLERAQGVVDDVSAQGQKLREVLSR